MSTKATTRHTSGKAAQSAKRSAAAVPAKANRQKPAAPKAKPSAPQSHGKAAADAALFHHMHALLHTMQTIQQYEEHLCSMTNEIRKSGRISAALRRDLHDLLQQLPAAEYQNGIDQIYDELDKAA